MSCKAIDKQVACREDAEMAKLMDQFVCVRIVQGWGMDLALFQFDNELTWAVFFMNADKTVYGRYGTRADHKDTGRHISIEGLKQAMEGALELHKGYPGNKRELAGKTGAAPPWRTPESIPYLQGKPSIKPADGTRGGCIHCHQAGDGIVWSLRASRQPLQDKYLWPYPVPDRLGLSLNPKERATVESVAAGTPAEKAGFKTGDKILRFEGQPILSIADVQWVLHNAKDPGTVKAEVDRGGQKQTLSLSLPAGWRQKDDFTWRVIVWSMRHKLLGTEPLETVSDGERKTLGVNGGMALRIKGLPPGWVKEKNPGGSNFKPGDVIVDVDGRKNLVTESDLLAYLMRKAPGQPAAVTVLRGGRTQTVQLTMP